MMEQFKFFRVVFGCDPEFFFRKGKEIIGAENILPLSGLEYEPGEFAGKRDGGALAVEDTVSRIIIDGVQAELNPRPNTCRELLGNEFSCIFRKMKEYMAEYNGLSIDFSQTIKLTEQDFENLPENSKKFGCMPSKNAHDGGKEGFIKVDPTTYRFRSAGGHIHLGAPTDNPDEHDIIRAVLDNPVRLVNMMDILVGNTCVLLDRDAGNVERRKVYGRAGEFRTPPHGVEYRTLSNFWLRSYQLMSMVMGLSRHAVLIVANDLDGLFLEKVDMEDIARAINTNDYALALKNFRKIEEVLLEVTPANSDSFPISTETIEEFWHFVAKGLDYWFPEDPMEHWISLGNDDNDGFETFLLTTVRNDMRK